MKRSTILFVLPTLFFGAVLVYMVLWDAYYSLTDWSSAHIVPQLVGFKTIATTVSNPSFLNALDHSAIISIVAVAAGNLLGVSVAGLLYFLKSSKRKVGYMSIFIYPLAISMPSNALIWLWLFNPSQGFNWLLKSMSLPTYTWLSSTATQLPSFLILVIWAYSGLAVIFYLASFLGIDRTIIEAAKLDGASDFKIFRKLLVPNSMNGFIVATALLFLFSFRIFSLSYVIGGGPTNPGYQTIVMYSYYLFYTESFAQAASVSVVITLIAALIVIPYAIFGIRRWITHG